MKASTDFLTSYTQALKSLHGAIPSETEALHEALRTAGLSEATWQASAQHFEALCARGDLFEEAEEYTEAAALYEQAIVLRPMDIALAERLAQLFIQQWEQTFERHPRNRAQFYLNKCLYVDPKHKTARLLTKRILKMEKKRQKQLKEKKRFQWKTWMSWVVFWVLAALLIWLGIEYL